jgi:hypothetical protein
MVHPVCIHLRDRVKNVLSQRGESIRWLSKQTKVDYQKLYRLESGDLRSLSFFDARRISRFVEPDRFKETLEEYFPEEVRDLTDAGYSEQDLDVRTEALEFLTSSDSHYQIYLFAAETPGATRETVAMEFGRRGLLTLDELLEKKALSLKADGSFQGVLNAPDALIKNMGHIHVDLIDLSEAGSFMRSFHRGLNMEGLRRAYGSVARASHEICAILENPEYRGPGLMIFNLACGIVGQKGQS